MELNSQVVSFLITIITGALLGILFDGYRVLRNTFGTRGKMTSLTDLLYWLVATVVVFLALVISNWGELRFYVFLGILSGVGLYYRLVSGAAICCFLAVIRLLKSILILIKKIVKNIFIMPVLFFVRIVSWPIRFLVSKVKGWYPFRYSKPPKDEKI